MALTNRIKEASTWEGCVSKMTPGVVGCELFTQIVLCCDKESAAKFIIHAKRGTCRRMIYATALSIAGKAQGSRPAIKEIRSFAAGCRAQDRTLRG
eukprot:614196-Pelagomonas_calceolata.AAC.2